MIKIWKDQKTPALAIVARGDQITTITPNQRYKVQSQSNPQKYYDVIQNDNQYYCTCEHYKTTKRHCIHITGCKIPKHP